METLFPSLVLIELIIYKYIYAKVSFQAQNKPSTNSSDSLKATSFAILPTNPINPGYLEAILTPFFASFLISANNPLLGIRLGICGT